MFKDQNIEEEEFETEGMETFDEMRNHGVSFGGSQEKNISNVEVFQNPSPQITSNGNTKFGLIKRKCF